jgi:hypothetical protein
VAELSRKPTVCSTIRSRTATLVLAPVMEAPSAFAVSFKAGNVNLRLSMCSAAALREVIAASSAASRSTLMATLAAFTGGFSRPNFNSPLATPASCSGVNFLVKSANLRNSYVTVGSW